VRIFSASRVLLVTANLILEDKAMAKKIIGIASILLLTLLIGIGIGIGIGSRAIGRISRLERLQPTLVASNRLSADLSTLPPPLTLGPSARTGLLQASNLLAPVDRLGQLSGVRALGLDRLEVHLSLGDLS
jgi:hypothetical protein